MKYLFFTVLVMLSAILKAGKIDKGFDAMNKLDFFGAKELFVKAIDKEPIPAFYGMSLVFGVDKSPFYNLDSAYFYITKSTTRLPKAETGVLADYQDIPITSSLIYEWEDTLDARIFKIVQKENTEQAFNIFLEQHKDALQQEEAIKYRNRLAFQSAKEKNSARAYKIFMSTYPGSEQEAEALELYEKQLFLEYTESDQVLSYVNFLKEYPESPYRRVAQDSIYNKSTRTKDINSYHDFVQAHPSNPNTDEAWRNIYQLYTADYSPQKIIEFRIEYPDYPFVEELKTDMQLAAKQYLPFTENDRFGFMDVEGVKMINADYRTVDDFSEGLALVNKSGKIGFIDKSGKLIIPAVYDDGEAFSNGLAVISKNGLYGMIDRTNKVIIPIKYELVGQFFSGLALVANENAYGYVNKKGKVVIPLDLEYANDFKDGFAVIEQKGKKGMINTLGKTVIPTQYQWLEPFNKYAVARAKNDSAFGVLNNRGEAILPFEYDQIGPYSEGLALVVKGDQYGYIDRVGKKIIPIKYDYDPEVSVWGDFKNGFVKFKKGDKYGVLNLKGEEVFPNIFENVGTYQPNGLIAVKRRGKWGYSDQKLKLAIPYKYELAESFKNGLAKVKTEEGWNLINEKGVILIDSAMQSINFMDTLINVQFEEKFGLLSPSLEVIVPIMYDRIENYNQDYYRLTKMGAYYYMDRKTFKIIP